jgi:hypothetical protein
LSIADSRHTAQIFLRASASFLTPEQSRRAPACFLVCVDIIGSIAKLAASLSPQEGAQAVKELRSMVVAHVAAMLGVDVPATAQPALVHPRSRSRGKR